MGNEWFAAVPVVGAVLSDRRSGSVIVCSVLATAMLIEAEWVKTNVEVIGAIELLAAAVWFVKWGRSPDQPGHPGGEV